MKMPRDVSGDELALLLSRCGYSITRQTGSHLRLTSTSKGTEHHITIPRHSPLKIGTLSAILKDAAIYLEIDRQKLMEDLFK
ncbi:MAG TPA: type II toxin-antitoxin system HicA family toxin [Nitrospirota bacterium]|nr:type II toxin-antitoxin system HicA family toxin [Nitrospirota bacterium]